MAGLSSLKYSYSMDGLVPLKSPPVEMGGFQSLMMANRGEISIRIARSAHELGLRTVAVYSYEDRYSMHRYKADEAWQIAAEGVHTPVGAYLAIDDIIKIAKDRNVDAIHPGYGFLSENARFARRCEEEGIAFVGPPSHIIEIMGDKTSARNLAAAAGVPTVPGSDGPVKSVAEVRAFAEKFGFPIIIKAAMGGGGRGMRVVRDLESLNDNFNRAISEALQSFGDGTVFVERFLNKPKHIEVQLLGDKYGDIVHLFERDCSVQRRHQKVVEIAPAINLASTVTKAIIEDALKLARHCGYVNAGTAEFLVDSEQRHYFIEINPRIQVEHTITEEVTGIDIVSAQIGIAAGKSLESLGLSQDKINTRGYAIQCRITTEDPANKFAPDTGKIEVYRSAGGNGVRLDGGAGYAGASITPHYDSLLVKVTCRGSDFETARRKVLRALAEFRIRGVKTNIPFLFNLLNHADFIGGSIWTTFIDDTPDLFDIRFSRNRAQKILAYLADMIVNGSKIQGQVGAPGILDNDPQLPQLLDGKDFNESLLSTPLEPHQGGWRQIFLREGPEKFAQAVRTHANTLVMDTTWRDAHQSLLATRLRTIDMAKVAPLTSHLMKSAFALETWGGATFDCSLRFLYECPWERLRTLRKLCPNIPFQMLLRGANAVGYTSYPDNVIYAFCKQAKECGVDIFRVFDSLNYVENLALGIEAVRAAGGVIEATICYTGDVADHNRKRYNLAYYMDLVDTLVGMKIHILGVKDMAGLLKPQSARILIGSIRSKYPNLPIHVHTHDTAGNGVASMIAAAESGADIIDLAVDCMSGITSQPCMGAVIAALEGTPQKIDIPFRNVQVLNSYWEQVRLLYTCFDPQVNSPSSEVYDHEMPGGQYTNLLFQATTLGLGTRWAQVKKAYALANKLCGDIVKVTPSSKVVGDLAQFLVANDLWAKTEEEIFAVQTPLNFPNSVVSVS
eukprot:Partr_v1_DN28202_c1_g1_i3_m76090 putative Catalyzes a 2-step reaction, involving the ATP-dependent carboxylation of the covalently attached biotin in the first step and the transfer of the carboxyl group to pyruvate in the second (By similarity)